MYKFFIRLQSKVSLFQILKNMLEQRSNRINRFSSSTDHSHRYYLWSMIITRSTVRFPRPAAMLLVEIGCKASTEKSQRWGGCQRPYCPSRMHWERKSSTMRADKSQGCYHPLISVSVQTLLCLWSPVRVKCAPWQIGAWGGMPPLWKCVIKQSPHFLLHCSVEQHKGMSNLLLFMHYLLTVEV